MTSRYLNDEGNTYLDAVASRTCLALTAREAKGGVVVDMDSPNGTLSHTDAVSLLCEIAARYAADLGEVEQ